MFIHYISDLHLEKFAHRTSILLKRQLDMSLPYRRALFIAGDLGNPFDEPFSHFLYTASDLWERVFFTPGNHEYDKARCPVEMNAIDAEIDWIANQRNNIHILQAGRQYHLENKLIIGGCLWSHTDGTSWRQNERNKRHQIEVRTMNNIINNCRIPIIAMTHYLPTFRLIDPKFDSFKPNYWASHSDFLIRFPITTWICGHSHIRKDVRLSFGFSQDVRFLMNATGQDIQTCKID